MRTRERRLPNTRQACFRSGRISALKVPSAQNPTGYCLNIFIEALVIGERVAIRDNSGRLKAEINGWIPKPPSRPSPRAELPDAISIIKNPKLIANP